MRTIFNALEKTTPTPACVAAKKAFTDFRAVMLEQSEDRCTKKNQYFKINPDCTPNCLAKYLKQIKPFVKRIKDYQETIADKQATIIFKQVIIANKERLIKNPATPAGQKNEAMQAKRRQEDAVVKLQDAIGNLEFSIQGEQIGINGLAIDYVVQVQEIASYDAERLDLLATKKELIKAIRNVTPKCNLPSANTEFDCPNK